MLALGSTGPLGTACRRWRMRQSVYQEGTLAVVRRLTGRPPLGGTPGRRWSLQEHTFLVHREQGTWPGWRTRSQRGRLGTACHPLLNRSRWGTPRVAKPGPGTQSQPCKACSCQRLPRRRCLQHMRRGWRKLRGKMSLLDKEGTHCRCLAGSSTRPHTPPARQAGQSTRCLPGRARSA